MSTLYVYALGNNKSWAYKIAARAGETRVILWDKRGNSFRRRFFSRTVVCATIPQLKSGDRIHLRDIRSSFVSWSDCEFTLRYMALRNVEVTLDDGTFDKQRVILLLNSGQRSVRHKRTELKLALALGVTPEAVKVCGPLRATDTKHVWWTVACIRYLNWQSRSESFTEACRTIENCMADREGRVPRKDKDKFYILPSDIRVMLNRYEKVLGGLDGKRLQVRAGLPLEDAEEGKKQREKIIRNVAVSAEDILYGLECGKFEDMPARLSRKLQKRYETMAGLMQEADRLGLTRHTIVQGIIRSASHLPEQSDPVADT